MHFEKNAFQNVPIKSKRDFTAQDLKIEEIKRSLKHKRDSMLANGTKEGKKGWM